MELAGYNLHHIEIARLMNLLSCEVEGAFSRPGAGEVDFYVDFLRTQTVYQTGWATNTDLGGRDIFGIDLQVRGNVVKLDGNSDSDLSDGIASNSQPQSNGEEQREDLQAQIVEHIFVKRVGHN
jgi:hypothetical protein